MLSLLFALAFLSSCITAQFNFTYYCDASCSTSGTTYYIETGECLQITCDGGTTSGYLQNAGLGLVDLYPEANCTGTKIQSNTAGNCSCQAASAQTSVQFDCLEVGPGNCSTHENGSCTECNNGFLLDADHNQCVTQCPLGMYQWESICYRGGTVNCQQTDSNGTCLDCKAGFLLNARDNQCLPQCPYGMYQDGSNCHSYVRMDCDQCRVTYPYGCAACPTNFFMLESATCVNKCPIGYNGNSATKSCESMCPDGTYRGFNDSCVACSSSCKTCMFESNFCHSCADGKTLYNFACVDPSTVPACPDGFYRDSNNNCLQRLPECLAGKQCTVDFPFNCTTCSGGKFLFDASCISFCPMGFHGDVATNTCVVSTIVPDGNGYLPPTLPPTPGPNNTVPAIVVHITITFQTQVSQAIIDAYIANIAQILGIPTSQIEYRWILAKRDVPQWRLVIEVLVLNTAAYEETVASVKSAATSPQAVQVFTSNNVTVDLNNLQAFGDTKIVTIPTTPSPNTSSPNTNTPTPNTDTPNTPTPNTETPNTPSPTPKSTSAPPTPGTTPPPLKSFATQLEMSILFVFIAALLQL